MADVVQLAVRLKVDDVVKPAERAVVSIEKISKTLLKLNRSSKKVKVHSFHAAHDWKTISSFSKRLEKTWQRMGQADPFLGLEKFLPSAKKGASLLGPLANAIPVIGSAVSLIVSVVSKAANAAKSLFKFVMKSVMAAEKLVPPGTEAYAAQKALLAISNKIGKSFKIVSKEFQALVDAGVSDKVAKNLILFKADLEAVAKTPAKLKRVSVAFKAIEKAVRSGKFAAGDFNAILKATGVSKFQLLARVSKLTGKSVKQLGSNMKKLPVDATVKALQQLFLESNKATEAGSLATKKQMATISGAWAALKNKVGNALTELFLKIGPDIRKTIIPVIKDMMKALESPAGKKAIAGIGVAIKYMAQILKAAWSVAKGFISGFLEGFKALGKGLNLADGKINPKVFKMLGEAAATFGRQLGAIAGALASIAVSLNRITMMKNPFKLLGTGGGLGPGLGGLGGGLGATMGTQAVGKSMTDGMVAGIKGGQSSVVASMLSVVKAAITAAKSALGTRSPSKVFNHLGQMSAIGFAQGMESVNAIPSLQGTAQLAPGLGGATSVNQTNVFETSVNEAASAASTAAEIKKQQLLQMAIAFERAALELGVSIK